MFFLYPMIITTFTKKIFIMEWLIRNWLEIFAVVSGLIYLYLEIKGNVLIWPIGILTSSLYIVVFYESGFFADMGLNVYYVLIGIYGWYMWKTKEPNSDDELHICNVTKPQIILLSLASIILFYCIYYILLNYTSSTVPVGDALTTSLSFVATWMLAKKIIQQWFVWVLANVLSMGLYVYKGLYPTSILFFFYTTMSFVGYIEWKKYMTLQDQKTS